MWLAPKKMTTLNPITNEVAAQKGSLVNSAVHDQNIFA